LAQKEKYFSFFVAIKKGLCYNVIHNERLIELKKEIYNEKAFDNLTRNVTYPSFICMQG
jgi:hypothetical protein